MVSYEKNKVHINNWRESHKEDYNKYMNSYYEKHSEKINGKRKHKNFVEKTFKTYLKILL